MKAFHSFWSEPNRIRNRGELAFPDFEQLTAILSALEWRRHSGPVFMISDSAGAEFFLDSGLSPFWDGIEVTLDSLNGRADPFAFWAAGKLCALKTMPVPCVMLDTDLIIWDNVERFLKADAVAAHAEALNPRSYPDRKVFHFRNSYCFPEDWDFSLDAANTAFLYIRDATFRDRYVNEAMGFLQNVETDGLTPVQTMCFAEQRILPMCAKACGATLAYLMRPEEVFRQEMVTHTWGFKQVLRENRLAREEFSMRCIRRIMSDFPETEALLANCLDLSGYLQRYRDAKADGLIVTV